MSAALLAGIDKMKKPELLQLCDKHKLDPGSVADMKYKLKRFLEEKAAPPAKVAKTAATTVVVAANAADAASARKEVVGDFCLPKGPAGPRFLVHVALLAPNPKWQRDGAMAQISRVCGMEPQIQYEAMWHTQSAGGVQYTECGGEKVVSTLFGLSLEGDTAVFQLDDFVEGIKTVARRAKKDGGTVHIHRPDPLPAAMDWDVVQGKIDALVVAQGVDVWVYSSPTAVTTPSPAADSGPSPTPASTTPATPAPPGVASRVEGKRMADFPLEKADVKLRRIDKDTQEFWDLEERFYANIQGRNEDYVEARIKAGKRPVKFVLIGAERVENEILECRFELKKRELDRVTKQKQRTRVSFHATHPKNVMSICKTSLLPFKHPLNPCKSQVDDGYFGTNKKGIYVSRYADYTLKYANHVVPLEPKDVVKTIMFKTLPGRSKHFAKMPGAIDPTKGFDSHSSPTWMEWYLFNEAQALPEYVCQVRAEEDTRTKSDDE
eukprot:Hpha_TRINITY_DN328_c0_g1::TRINITY_DN328_c0_g1_i1::g.112599::m.112599